MYDQNYLFNYILYVFQKLSEVILIIDLEFKILKDNAGLINRIKYFIFVSYLIYSAFSIKYVIINFSIDRNDAY